MAVSVISEIVARGAEVNPSDITLLLTRPAAAGRRFADMAEGALGRFARIVLSPVLEIAPLDPFPRVPPGVALAFTSENAVRIAARHLSPGAAPVWCVGARTARAARDAGWVPRVGGNDVAALADAISRNPPDAPLVHLSGVHQAGDLAESLRRAGHNADRIAIYDQIPRALTDDARAALAGDMPVLAPLFSPRSATLLAAQVPGAPGAPLLIAALSPAVADAWHGPSAASTVARAPDMAALIDAMAHLIDAFSNA